MIKILESLGFERAGMPFLRRSQDLVLYTLSGRSIPSPGAVV